MKAKRAATMAARLSENPDYLKQAAIKGVETRRARGKGLPGSWKMSEAEKQRISALARERFERDSWRLVKLQAAANTPAAKAKRLQTRRQNGAQARAVAGMRSEAAQNRRRAYIATERGQAHMSKAGVCGMAGLFASRRGRTNSYKGRSFRSSWEVVMAKFLDIVGGNCWDYEARPFDIGGGILYVPDFFIKFTDGREVVVEVKADRFDEKKKFQKFRSIYPDIPSMKVGKEEIAAMKSVLLTVAD
jgi:hypothetical protein